MYLIFNHTLSVRWESGNNTEQTKKMRLNIIIDHKINLNEKTEPYKHKYINP